MRAATAGELAALAGPTRDETIRVKVANGDGTMIDLTSWVETWKIEEDQDQPVAALTISFRRDSATQSLSPLREDSTLNRLDDGLTYSPLIQLNRRITFEAAVTAMGTLASDSDFKLLFDGTIHNFDPAGSPFPVECRDKFQVLVNRWVETEQNYGSIAGDDLEDVIQAEIDDVLGGGVVTLYTPVSPTYVISPAFRQQRQSLADAILALQQLPGWDVRYRWDDGTSLFRLTLRDPDRGKTIPDHTYGPTDYFSITRLEFDETDIRNALQLRYPTGSGNFATLTVTDASSISEFGRLFQFMQESDTSPINTSGEATTMLNAALADLKDPKVDKEVEMKFDWRVQLGDLCRFSANGVHYNSDQDLAVVSYRHEGTRTSRRTMLSVRGSPAGGYLTWLRRARGLSGALPASRPPVATVESLDTEADSLSRALRFDAVPGSGGGGTVIAWEIGIKTDFAPESIFNSGDGSVLPLDTFILRIPRSDKEVRYRVTDTATGLFDEIKFTVPSSRLELTDLGEIVGDTPLDDGTYIGRSTTPDGLTAPAGAVDSGLRLLNLHVNKASDDLDDLNDGTTYARPLASRLSAGKPIIDFSEAIHANKNIDNIADGSTYKRVLGTATDGTGKIDLAGAGVVGKNLDNIADSGTYSRTTANEKTGAARAFSAIDAAGKIAAFQLRGSSGTPSMVVPTGPGAMGTSPSGTITGSDSAGLIETTVGTSPAAGGEICTVTFTSAYPAPPFVVIAGALSAGGVNARAYAYNISTTQFTIRTDAGYGGAGAHLNFYYVVIG